MSQGPATDSSGRIVPREQRRKDLHQMLQDTAVQTWLKQILPHQIGVDRFTRIAMTSLRRNPDLLACEPGSFLSSLLAAASLGLEIDDNLGHAYLVPYKTECTLIIGYRGFQELAYRSGRVQALWADVVRDGDHFEWERGLTPNLVHRPIAEPRIASIRANGQNFFHVTGDNVTHAYACAVLSNGQRLFTVLTRRELDALRSRSRASHAGPWVTDPEQMMAKTAIRRLGKSLPLSPEARTAIALDESADMGTQLDVIQSVGVPRLDEEGVPEQPEERDESEDASLYGVCPVHKKAWIPGGFGGFYHQGGCNPGKIATQIAESQMGWTRQQLNDHCREAFDGATSSKLTPEQLEEFVAYANAGAGGVATEITEEKEPASDPEPGAESEDEEGTTF